MKNKFIATLLLSLLTFSMVFSVSAHEDDTQRKTPTEFMDMFSNTGEEAIPLISLPEIANDDYDFSALKNSVKYFCAITYENGQPIGELCITKENDGSYKFNTSTQYPNPADNKLAFALKDTQYDDVIILRDRHEEYLLIKQGDEEFVLPVDVTPKEPTVYSLSTKIDPKELLEAVVYRNINNPVDPYKMGGVESAIDSLA